MLGSYTKQKILIYISNALCNKRFVNDNFDEICSWIFSKSQNYLEVCWGDSEADDNETAFRNFAGQHRMKAIEKITNYGQKLKNMPMLKRHYADSNLAQNLQYLQKLFSLSDVCIAFLEFVIMENCNDEFRDMLCDLKIRNRDLSLEDKGVFLHLNRNLVHKMCNRNYILCQLGLVNIDYEGRLDISCISKHFYYQKFRSVEDIVQYLLGKKLTAHLAWDDFEHIKDIEFVAHILQSSLKKTQKGVNILFYGEPGTGKTEFAKALAEKVSAELYAIGENPNSYIGDDEHHRYQELLRTQIILKTNQQAVLLVDECDDLLYNCTKLCGSSNDSEISKIKINRLIKLSFIAKSVLFSFF